MLPELKYEWKVQQLQRARRRLLADYKKQRLQLPKGPDRKDARESLIAREMIDVEEANEEISSLTTSHLVEEAQRLIVPIPEHADERYWKFDDTFGRWHLTTEGVIKLRADIRAERKARREPLMTLLPVTIGLIGALTGLLAVILKK
jgi:hypothetical protein